MIIKINSNYYNFTRLYSDGSNEENVAVQITSTKTNVKNTLAINSDSTISSNTVTINDDSQTIVDSFPISSYRSAKYYVQMTHDSEYHVIELRVLHDGSTVYMIQYGEMHTNSVLGS